MYTAASSLASSTAATAANTSTDATDLAGRRDLIDYCESRWNRAYSTSCPIAKPIIMSSWPFSFSLSESKNAVNLLIVWLLDLIRLTYDDRVPLNFSFLMRGAFLVSRFSLCASNAVPIDEYRLVWLSVSLSYPRPYFESL